MNILLLNGLPEDYEGIPISPDYRNMIQVDLILRDPDLSDADKVAAALDQLYPEIPEDIAKAVNGLDWFFTRGQIGGEGKEDGRAPQRAFDFSQDANLIYSAFYATYNISLTTIDFLHWWEFMALFEGLPESTLIKRVIYWRTADLTGLPKEERRRVQKMRRLFALKQTDAPPLSVEEVNRQTMERVAKRFEAAEKALKGGEKMLKLYEYISY